MKGCFQRIIRKGKFNHNLKLLKFGMLIRLIIFAKNVFKS